MDHEWGSQPAELSAEILYITAERLTTSILGSLLILTGITSRGIRGVLMMIGGGYLVARALRGAPGFFEKYYRRQEMSSPIKTSADEDRESGTGYGELEDEVVLAGYESFPASDPPAWTTGNAD